MQLKVHTQLQKPLSYLLTFEKRYLLLMNYLSQIDFDRYCDDPTS